MTTTMPSRHPMLHTTRLALPALAIAALCACTTPTGRSAQPSLQTRTIAVLTVDGLRFKDHNKNGVLDGYEDWRNSPRQRARDLVARMTLDEKAGAMMHANPPSTASGTIPGAGTAWERPGIDQLLLDQHITAFLNRLNTDVAAMARQANELQATAERGRLGIPVTLSSDPRNQFQASQGVSVSAGRFTQWPDPAGLAATGDAELVRRFADSVRQEYLAVGIRMALSPQADLAINPRWHRTNGTFGGERETARRLVNAYVTGMQAGAGGLHADSVVSVVKHWVGYGATGPQGYDSHNYYGRHMYVGSDTIEDHIYPFTGAFAAQVGAVMPTYGQPQPGLMVQGADGPIEPVGIGFNQQMLGEVLRGRFGFDGVVLSDWQITDDCLAGCRDGAPAGQKPNPADIAMPWGVEELSKESRFAKAVEAGVDQFGGAKDPQYIVSAVRNGRLPQAALDRAVTRIVLQKFQLGLFEDPYVDVDAAIAVVGNAGFQALALDAQRRSAVLVQNQAHTLPLKAPAARKVFLYQIDPASARRRGFDVVDTVEQADFAIMAITTPNEVLHPQHFFGSRYREGDTAFKAGGASYEAFKRISAKVPTVVSVYMDRPADLSALIPAAAAIVVHFGLGTDALFDMLSGVRPFEGRLPYDLPLSVTVPASQGQLATRMGQGLRD